MLKIDRSEEGGSVCLTLSGRIERDVLTELDRAIANETAGLCSITIDLREVRLLDRKAVRFLVRFEVAGVQFVGCPAYIREWMDRERPLGTDELDEQRF